MSGDSFDYVIAGAGSAGCVLAARLSETTGSSVLLLEAGGPDKRQEIHIPAAFSKLFKTDHDWAYQTEPQPHLAGRSLYWPRGKVLGGSSSMNAMIYTRGLRRDFDRWQAMGNAGWSWEDVRPYFERGGIVVSDLRTKNVLTRAFVDACAETGIPRNDDFNGAALEGAGFFRVTQKRGQRQSTAVAFLKPALARPNLTVRTHAHATRVLFEGTRAFGVEYVHDGVTTRARAEREVILSGGAINSPQLLLLSGVGPADDLKRAGIAVVADLPGTGANLQDHLASGVSYECTKPVTLAAAETIGNLLRYLIARRGMLTSNVAEAGAFLRTRDSLVGPDLEILFGPTFYMNHGFANPPGHGFTLGAIVLQPRSRGRIALRSANPLEPPAIDPNYLSERADLDVLIEGVKRCRRIASVKPFDEFRGAEVWPGAGVQSDDDFAEFIRSTAETLYHPVGTCRMGSDDQAVVDDRLRVRGVEALRVVDASIMPTIVSAHPNAAVIMIAEKAAEMIHG